MNDRNNPIGELFLKRKVIWMDINSKKWKKVVIDGAGALGVEIDAKMADAIGIHAEELIRWNRITNLTAITDPMEVAVKHFIDSVVVAKMVGPNSSLLDIGTGGGFPGIPLKIILPDLTVTLIDAARKRVSFLKHMIRVLKLSGITAHHVRGENVTDAAAVKTSHDFIVCRAFTGLDRFVPMALPLLKQGGTIIAMKGRETEGEMEALNSVSATDQNGRIIGIDELSIELTKYRLPFIESERSIFSIGLKQGG